MSILMFVERRGFPVRERTYKYGMREGKEEYCSVKTGI